jgi:alpha-amylase
MALVARMKKWLAGRASQTVSAVALAAVAGFALNVNTATAQTRTAFVQLFEWKWTDIAKECESYLGPKGFAAVQVSPPNEHNWVATGDGAPYPWWMRYQPVGYSLDSSRSGTRAQFVDMVNRCNAVGVGVYVDAVINHMSGGNSGTSSAGNSWTNKNYPRVPYGPTDFHSTCGVSNYNDAGNVQNCELSGLQDLNTGSTYVRGKIADYLVGLVNIGVKGFRVDAAKHISPTDLSSIVDAVNSRVTNKPYWFLEVIGAPGEAVQPSQYYGINSNLVNITEFAYGPKLHEKFAGGGKLADLRTFGETWGFMPSNRAVVFTDNHDKQRGHGGGGNYLTYHYGATYDLGNVFMLGWPFGYPVIMSSYAFNRANDFDTSYGPPHNTGGATKGPWDGGVTSPSCFVQTVGGWVCEHRWRPIGNMVGFRNATIGTFSVSNWWDNANNQIAFGRGDKGFVVINKEGTALSRTFTTSMAAGKYCDIISGDYTAGTTPTCSGNVVTVDSTGKATINVPAFAAAAIHVGAKMASSTPPTQTATVTFKEVADTNLGQNIYVVGNSNAIGNWAPGSAVKLNYISGVGTRGNWSIGVTFPAGTRIEYKYIKKDGAGNVVWESGANRVVTVGAAGTTVTTNDTWR